MTLTAKTEVGNQIVDFEAMLIDLSAQIGAQMALLRGSPRRLLKVTPVERALLERGPVTFDFRMARVCSLRGTSGQ